MKLEIPMVKVKEINWSLNLEDEAFADKPEELIEEAVRAVGMTAVGYYVNLVTPAEAGHPELGLLDSIQAAIEATGIAYTNIAYLDECGCGGFVSRVYR